MMPSFAPTETGSACKGDATENIVVAIQYDWALASYTRDLLLAVADSGRTVHFFIDAPSLAQAMVDPETLRHPNILLHTLRGKRERGGIAQRVCSRAREMLALVASDLSLFVDKHDRAEVCHFARRHKREIAAILGIETSGLAMAAMSARRCGVPHIYYSLELRSNPRRPDWRRTRLSAIIDGFHRDVRATIIQDERRAETHFQIHSISHQRALHFPVSAARLPAPRPERPKLWHEKFNLGAEVDILLYFGKLNARSRGLEALISAWPADDKRFALVLHGTGEMNASLAAAARARGVFVSTDFLSEAEIPDWISSAQVGFCYYDNTDVNDRLTAFSSEKIALFLRSGVPIITNDNESYRDLYDMYRCGLPLGRFDEIADRMAKIMESYQHYSAAATTAYDSVYCLEENARKLLGELDTILQSNPHFVAK